MKEYIVNGIKNPYKYTFRGSFNTYDGWNEYADNEEEFSYIVDKILNNSTILDGWTIENNLRSIFYTHGEGFSSAVPHPKFAEKYLS